MPFPLTIVGSFEIKSPGGQNEQNAAAIEAAVTDWLVQKNARKISKIPQGISFEAGLFRFVWNWDPLVAISSGNVEFDHKESATQVAYYLSLTETIIVGTLMIVFGFVVVPIVAAGFAAIPRIEFLALGWFWLVGGNYLIAKYRVPSALKNVTRRAVKGRIL